MTSSFLGLTWTIVWLSSASLVLSCKSSSPRQETERGVMEVPSLLEEETDRDLSSVRQCEQDGVERCRAVRGDLEFVRGLRAGTRVTLLPSLIPMELRRDPEQTSSGGLSLAFTTDDGGEANIVVGSTGSMYGNINLGSGDIMYALEACGGGCNVLLERNRNYFDNMRD